MKTPDPRASSISAAVSSLLFCFALLCAAPAAAQSMGGPGDALELLESGGINWTVGEVYAVGIGAPPARAVNAAQARAMAERVAYVVALRNLLETVKGVRIDSQSVVENFMTKSDVIRTRVDGIVKGARIVKTRYLSDGSVETLVAMPMKGAFLNVILPETFGAGGTSLPKPVPTTPPRQPDIRPSPAEPVPTPAPQKRPEPPKQEPMPLVPENKTETKTEPVSPLPSVPQVEFKGGVATGLVIDGRGLGLRPALMPRILDHQGQEIYVGRVVTRTNAVEQGVAGYAKDVNAAVNNFRVTDNPVVIKGVRAAGAARTDIVLARAEADALRQLSGKGDFLQYCRVIIVY